MTALLIEMVKRVAVVAFGSIAGQTRLQKKNRTNTEKKKAFSSETDRQIDQETDGQTGRRADGQTHDTILNKSSNMPSGVVGFQHWGRLSYIHVLIYEDFADRLMVRELKWILHLLRAD